jgi:hypothetical protein
VLYRCGLSWPGEMQRFEERMQLHSSAEEGYWREHCVPLESRTGNEVAPAMLLTRHCAAFAGSTSPIYSTGLKPPD